MLFNHSKQSKPQNRQFIELSIKHKHKTYGETTGYLIQREK